MTITSDLPLILQLQAGNIHALGELYDLYRLPVYRAALAITRDEAAAEDILQEAFLRFHASIQRFDVNLPVAPWLYRIAVNLSYTWVTRRARWYAPLEDFFEQLISPAKHDPEPVFEKNDTLRRIQAALETLPVNHRVVIALYYLNELSLQEIAEIVECPVGTVKSRLYYGREALRRALGADTQALELVYEFT